MIAFPIPGPIPSKFKVMQLRAEPASAAIQLGCSESSLVKVSNWPSDIPKSERLERFFCVQKTLQKRDQADN